MARPTKLTNELLTKAAAYDFVKLKHAVPTIEGLALYIDVSRETIYAWRELNTPLATQFSDIVNKLMETQALELVNNGLRGRFNAKIVNMMLSKHGYVEKTEQGVSHSGAVSFVNDVPRPKSD